MSTSRASRKSRRAPHPAGLRGPSRCLALLSCLTILQAAFATGARAGWEHPGSKAEIFDLHAYQMPADPEGMASCTDALGGMIVASYDALASPGQIRVSRVAHDGTELWGQGGVLVPREIGSLGQRSPVAVAPDASGGAYIGYVSMWSGYDLFRIAHYTAAGAFDGSFSVDNPGTAGEYAHLSFKLVPLASGDVIAVWTQRSPTKKLHAARFNTAGALQWHTDVNQNYSHRDMVVTNTYTTWNVASDMLDGVLVTWLRLPAGNPPEIGAQRLGPDGAVWWGSDGQVIWSGLSLDFHDPVIVGDVIGGAFVVMSYQGRVRAQHLDPWGSAIWASGGIMVQDSGTPFWATSTDPAVCEDGAFGFIVVHGNVDLFTQRVDYWGSLLWGSGVAIGQRAGDQNEAAIASDGAQGAVLAWQDLYYGLPGQQWHVLVGTRLNGSGTSVWGPSDLYMAWTSYDPHDVQVVGDGASGALLAFANYDLSEHADDAWALGVGPSGIVGVEPGVQIPAMARLGAYPNPFAAFTRIVADVPAGGAGHLEVFDLSGRLVRVLGDALLEPGRRDVTWDGRDESGRLVANGVYLVRLSGPSFSTTTRVVPLR